MRVFVFITVALLVFVLGVRAFGCETVSFSADLVNCYSDTSGDLPGAPTGLGLMALSALIALVGIGRTS